MESKSNQKTGDDMKLFQNKKGFVTDWGDLFKGFFIGFLVGAVLIILGAKGVINLPLL